MEEKYTKEQLEAARKARNAKKREWRAKNRDKVKEYELRHWIKVAAAAAAQEGSPKNECGST